MSQQLWRVKPITFKLNCSEECQTHLRPYFQVHTGLLTHGTSCGTKEGGETKFQETIEIKAPENNIVHLVLRDSTTQELIGKACYNLSPLVGKKEKHCEWILLKDIIGREVGKAMVEFEPKEEVSTVSPLAQTAVSPTTEVDIDEVIESMKDNLATLMWETNSMFDDFRRRFLPDFWNFDLGLLDSPFYVEYLEGARRPHRHRRARRNREIYGQGQEMKPESEVSKQPQQPQQERGKTETKPDQRSSETVGMSGKSEARQEGMKSGSNVEKTQKSQCEMISELKM